MQQIPVTTIDTSNESAETSTEQLATLTLETIPVVMRAIRALMRAEAGAGTDLTVPQFRALGFIERHRGASLTQVAEHLGISMPSASRLIDALVNRRLVDRMLAADRRKVTLNLLPAGADLRLKARQRTQQGLDATFQRLTPAQRRALAKSLATLGELFGGEISSVAAATTPTIAPDAVERSSP